MRLLIVEDDLQLCNVLRRGLGEQGHVVDLANDGETGEQCAADGNYDAAIVDVKLPRKDGLALVRSLRSSGNELPVLILTSQDTVADVIEGLDAGADDYLRKPFVFAELDARLRSIARRRASARAGTELRVQDLVFDTATKRARRRNREINLTAREMAFLEYLMRNTDRVVSRRMLEEAMFDYASDVTSNVVDVYISRIRAKIGAGGEPQLLHTIRGVGYRLSSR